jgi:4-hydroxybenzoate polyprenyltransferase
MTTLDLRAPARSQWLALADALRIHQWVKNLLVLVPVLLDHKVSDPAVVLRALIAFAAFCFAASGAYVMNDLFDHRADRHHPTKRHRPFAAETLSRPFGMLMVPLLFAAALLCSLELAPKFVMLLTLYVVLTTAYSVFLKRVAVLDVLLLAGLYSLRVLAGVAATHVRFSTWLLAFSMFLFLSLAFLKRYAELSQLQAGAEESVARRGYLRGDREWLASMGGSSGYISVLVLALYINSDQVIALYHRPLLLWLICPLLLLWISRMWLLAHRGRIHQDPIVAAVRDPASYGIGTLVALIMYVAAYSF